MKNLLKIIILATIILVTKNTFAADISIYTNQIDIRTGDEFAVDVFVHSDEKLNAVEGKLIYPKNILAIKEIRDGNSVINFWIERPKDIEGIINFSGITPGGFKGSNQKVFSIVFIAENTGDILLALNEIKLLLADGKGTNAVESIYNTALNIRQGADNVVVSAIEDGELPEYFNPIISSDPNIFDGKNFIVFATQDKISGLSHFELREGFLDYYKKVESPYVLKNQKLNKNIKIKAVDLNGNERLVIVNAQNPTPWYKQYAIFGLILFVVIIFFLKKKYGKNI